MSRPAPFKTPQGEARFLAVYDAAMQLWPVPYEESDIPGRFGTTHVVVSGPKSAPPLVLLHGYMATLTMWSPNVAAWSGAYRCMRSTSWVNRARATRPSRYARPRISQRG